MSGGRPARAAMLLDPLRVSDCGPLAHGVRVLARLPLPVPVRVASLLALVLADEEQEPATITREGGELVIRGLPRHPPGGGG